MSQILYLASDYPLAKIENPHYKMLSVNEALALGMENIPEFMLAPEFNHDQPGVLLWSDTEITVDTERNTIDDGSLDDDFSILELDDATEDIFTQKQYRVYIEWNYAASAPEGRWAGQPGSHGAVPAGADAGSESDHQFDAGYDKVDGTTGWENERGIWEGNLAGAGTDEEYFEEAVLDLDDPQPDFGHLGTDAAYLVAGLMDLDNNRHVEDCTTIPIRPERKKHHGQTMGGM